MISLPLFKRNLISAWKILLIFFLLISMYTTVIIYMYDPALAEMLTEYQQVLPSVMSAMGMSGIASTLIEFIHIYLYGFIMEVFPMVFTVIAVNKFLTSYTDSGSMASLLATPNSRSKILRTQWLSVLLTLTILIAAITGVGLITSGLLFPGELAVKNYLILNVVLLLVHVCISSIIFLAACLFHETRKFYLMGAGIPVLFFLFTMLANMGGKLENVKYLSLFTLFPGSPIVAGDFSLDSGILSSSLILLGLTLVFSGIGFAYFKKKDLPL